MKDIVWCNYNQYELIYVFSNYKGFINDEKNYYDRKNINVDYDALSNKIINNYFDYWSILINNYSKNIKIVNSLKSNLKIE